MDAVATATASVPRLQPLNAVKDKTYPYAVFSAAFGRGDEDGYTLDSTHGPRWLRVVVQAFGRTADSALTTAERVVDALLDQRLAVTGYDCTPLRIELDPQVVRDPDDNGVVGVTVTFTATATKET